MTNAERWARLEELRAVLDEGLRIGIPGPLRHYLEQRIERLEAERDEV